MTWRYDATGAGTPFEQTVPPWAMSKCEECYATWRIEGHDQLCSQAVRPPRSTLRCHFCQEQFLVTPGDNEGFTEEVGEFWSEVLKRSVLAHPDCLPMGITATLEDEDPEWKMA